MSLLFCLFIQEINLLKFHKNQENFKGTKMDIEKENEKYIQDKINPILEKLVIDLLLSKPDNAV